MGFKRDAAMLVGGASLTAATLITVYEGKVLAAAGQGKQELVLTGGESARLDNKGAHKLAGSQEASRGAATASNPAPYVEANEHLAQEVASLNEQLRGLATQKKELEQKLTVAQNRLSAANDGAAVSTRHPFDLTQEDWVKLAEEGTVKYRTPCLRSEPYTPDAEALNNLGLSPEDAEPLRQAHAHSNQRLREVVQRLCSQAVGSEDVAQAIGVSSCQHVVVDMARQRDPTAADKAWGDVGLIRAGKMPEPPPGTPMHPMLEMLLTLTSEMSRFEAELASSFGPEEAHRIAYSDELCSGSSSWTSLNRKKKQ